MQAHPKEHITPQQALPKIQRYCAYQERSHIEVKRKLFAYGLHGGEVDEILAQLITDGFLNEERFAKAFAGGKFRIKQWGKLKIERELEVRGLTRYCIVRGLKEIDDADYRKTLQALVLRRAKQTVERDAFVKKGKVARFVIAKGYESDLVWDVVNELL